jgi:hypothetical protein
MDESCHFRKTWLGESEDKTRYRRTENIQGGKSREQVLVIKFEKERLQMKLRLFFISRIRRVMTIY